MKNNELQELKPVYIQEARGCSDDEISLIDLAIVLIKHKFVILVVLFIAVAAGIGFSSTITKSYTYQANINIGSYVIDGEYLPFEPPLSLIAKIEHGYIPTLLEAPEYNFSISASNPKKSEVIKLTASGKKDQGELMAVALNQLSQLIIDDHNQIYNALSASKTQQNLAATPSQESSAGHSITSLQKTSILTKPKPSGFTYSKNRKLILIISLVAGLFLGIFAAFMVEFISRVRAELHAPE